MPIGEYVSPDGQLKSLVTCPDGDWTLGFDGCPTHTHGSILAGLSGIDEVTAVERYLADLIGNLSVINIIRISGVLSDAWITDDPAEEVLSWQKYGAPDETVEFRLWNGTAVQP
ncbi:MULTISPECIES: hypothetical protein [unclassified Bradyrhizobium]|uniref:hypothetical protein n=1 Tax=unclassified Bradyrhizobium TaxID=2631580 RepID=UPI00291677BB|nr:MULTISPECIES: hypothetical protein [unclassified Bradyrhizobium]